MKNLNEMSVEELSTLNQEVVAMIRAKRSLQNATAAIKFRPGQRVSFKSSRSLLSPTVLCKVVKVNKTTITVRELANGKMWNVSASMLSAVLEEQTATA